MNHHVTYIMGTNINYHFSISYNTSTEPEPADLQWSGQKLQLTDVLWYNILTNSIYGVWRYIAIYVII